MHIKNQVELITYPNSLGENLKELRIALNEIFGGLFRGGVHILPPFPSSGDRGFAPIDYLEIDKGFGTWQDIEAIAKNHSITLDLMVNHISRQSEYFQDFLKRGIHSPYHDLFITIDKIWEDGIPVEADIEKMFLRRKLPYSTYETGSGIVNVWTTFGKTDPSEQIDIDVHSDGAWDFFEHIFRKFNMHNIRTVRLDAVGYVIKKRGTSCFFVEPEIYGFLERISLLAKKYRLTLLPEVHAHYAIQQKLAVQGFWIYDFVLPYKILESIIKRDFSMLGKYLADRPPNQFTTLDCHDGLPVMPDLNDLANIADMKEVVDICIKRGSNLSKVISDAHKLSGSFDVHQIRGTIYSMLDENDDDYLIARAIQFFTPGIPMVYYVGLLAGKNRYELVKSGTDGREINRYNYSLDEIHKEISRDVVSRLIRLIEFRNGHPSFGGSFAITKSFGEEIILEWHNGSDTSKLYVNFKKQEAYIAYSDDNHINKLVL